MSAGCRHASGFLLTEFCSTRFFAVITLRSQFYHIWVVLLSVAMHVGAAYAIVHAVGVEGGGGGHSNYGSTNSIEVRLGVSDNAGESDSVVPAELKIVDDAANSPQEEPGADSSPPLEGSQISSGSDPLSDKQNDQETPLVAVPLPAELHYFKPEELTLRPEVLEDVPPDFSHYLPDVSPAPAIVQLMINESGAIDDVIIQGSDFSEEARAFIKNAFANTRFRPGKIGGAPVKSQITIEVTLESVAKVQSVVPVH